MVVEWVIDLSSQNAADIKRVLDRSSTEFRLNKLLLYIVSPVHVSSFMGLQVCSKATEMTASVSKAAEITAGFRNALAWSEDYNQAEDYEDYVEDRDDV
ncbi:hypothetical protein Tco_0150277 [Tanacetum coccineum]